MIPVQQIDYRAKLKNAAEKAQRLGAKGAKSRLEWLIAEIDENRPESIHALSTGDLYSLVDVNGIIEGIRVKHATPTWLGILEWLRNILVLLPLVFTWYEISRAVVGYQSFLEAHPDQFNVPILYLWQTGFGGLLSGPFAVPLGALATGDAILLLTVVIFTFFIAWQAHIYTNFKDEQAEELRTDLADALAFTTLALATSPANPQQPINLVSHIDRVMKDLLEQIKQEHATMSTLTKALGDAAGEMTKSSQSMQSTSGSFAQTSRTFATTQQAFERTTDTLVTTNQGLGASVTSLSQAIQTLNNGQQLLVTTAENFITNLRDMITRQGTILDRENVLIDQQAATVRGLETLRQAVDSSIVALRRDVGALGQRASGVIQSLTTAGQAVADLVQQIQSLNQQQQSYVSDLAQMQRDQREMVTNLAALTGQILTDMKATEQYMQALPNMIQGIWTEAGNSVQEMGKMPGVVQNELKSILNAHYDAAGSLRNASQDLKDAANKLKGP